MGLGAGPREGEKALHALAIGFETLSNLTLSLLARDDLHAVAQLTSACEKYYIQLLVNMWNLGNEMLLSTSRESLCYGYIHIDVDHDDAPKAAALNRPVQIS